MSAISRDWCDVHLPCELVSLLSFSLFHRKNFFEFVWQREACAYRKPKSRRNGDLPCHYWRSRDRLERSKIRSILVAMMKSFSCSPLIFLVLKETVA